MPFTPDDIEPIGNVSGTTALEYAVWRDGAEIGRVRVDRASGLINSGQEPREWIARRLTAVEDSEGSDRLAGALRAILDLS
jgi:hypothetical protein